MRIALLFLGTFVVVAALAVVSGRYASFPEMERIFDIVYESLHRNFAEYMAVTALLVGIWNSIVRRRILVSAVFFVISFVFSLIVPLFG